ncbi:MAG: hypothetical protein NVSMB49_19230 [Ktedonobacteraceae bacterium]
MKSLATYAEISSRLWLIQGSSEHYLQRGEPRIREAIEVPANERVRFALGKELSHAAVKK